jgi:transposase
MIGSLDHAKRKLVVTTSRAKRSADFIAHLQVLDRLYGPKPGAPIPPVVLVLDNGPIHVSTPTLAALAKRAHWLTIEWLPKYAPELNGVEVVWGDLKARHLAHQIFTDPDVLDVAIHDAIGALNSQRNRVPLANQESLPRNTPRTEASCGLSRALKRDVIAEALRPTLEVCDGA